jgi:hypothetical protein
MKPLSGRITIAMDGEAISTTGTVTLRHGNPNRTAVMGNDGRPAGFNEEYEAPGMEITRITGPGIPLARVADATDIAVTIQTSAGQSWTLSGAVLSNRLEVDVKAATAPMTFIGETLEEN